MLCNLEVSLCSTCMQPIHASQAPNISVKRTPTAIHNAHVVGDGIYKEQPLLCCWKAPTNSSTIAGSRSSLAKSFPEH